MNDVSYLRIVDLSPSGVFLSCFSFGFFWVGNCFLVTAIGFPSFLDQPSSSSVVDQRLLERSILIALQSSFLTYLNIDFVCLLRDIFVTSIALDILQITMWNYGGRIFTRHETS